MGKSKREIQRFWQQRGVYIPMNHVFTVRENEQRIQQQTTDNFNRALQAQQESIARGQQQMAQALKDAANSVPLANRPLKASSYTPSFTTRKSRKERQAATGQQYQFANPLSMGIGLGSGATTGIGLG